MFKLAVSTLAASVAATFRGNEDTHPAYAPFAGQQDDIVSPKENSASLRKTEKSGHKSKSKGKISLARLHFEQYQDVDRSGQPITGEVANILAALPNRQLDTNFLSNLM